MQTGFYTRALNTLALHEVTAWAGTAGFEALEVDVACHVGNPSRIPAAVESVQRHRMEVCGSRE